jgi:hypothetical protein
VLHKRCIHAGRGQLLWVHRLQGGRDPDGAQAWDCVVGSEFEERTVTVTVQLYIIDVSQTPTHQHTPHYCSASDHPIKILHYSLTCSCAAYTHLTSKATSFRASAVALAPDGSHCAACAACDEASA